MDARPLSFLPRLAAALVAVLTQPVPLAVLLAGGMIAGAIANRPVPSRYAFNADGDQRLDTVTGEVAVCLPADGPTGGFAVACSAERK